MRKIYLFLSIIFFLFLPDYVFAKPVKIEIVPCKIFPGDAFLIKIKNLKNKNTPVALINKKEFGFVEYEKDSFIAIGAMDINTKPGRYKIKIKSGNRVFKRNLLVKIKNFPSLSLNLPNEKVFPSEDDLRRIRDEDMKMYEIFNVVTDKKWEGNFILPLENEISTLFGVRRIMNEKWTSMHRGIDFRGKEGEEVKATNNGQIVVTAELFYGGNTIVIDHGLGIYSIYMHLSCIRVKSGDEIKKGEIIGNVGSTGRATGPHLHFGIKINGININPVSLIKLNI